MPTYQYQCTECGESLEAVQRFTDDALTECPSCQGRLRKVFSAVGVVFKGSGFYRTDSRGGSSDAAASTSPNGNGDGGSGGNGSGGGEKAGTAAGGSDSSGSADAKTSSSGSSSGGSSSGGSSSGSTASSAA